MSVQDPNCLRLHQALIISIPERFLCHENKPKHARDFPRPDLGLNNGPFPIEIEQKLPKMVYIIQDSLPIS